MFDLFFFLFYGSTLMCYLSAVYLVFSSYFH